ncbi:hypothetical protein BS50DRAFT_579277 [Corynespora cassiicola Philippines]|uniref:Uncharacterized protein n=1 Tax=Corynespora cassiicola Philippines TaxID=1448308 RepID=A0A2T2N4U4_CORCC|nr:hypothetical protein BS50DRAFT_579277 [Corynespora cassiicola Philippines]
MGEPFSLIASGVTLIDASVKLGVFTKKLVALKDADNAVEDVKSNLAVGKTLMQHVVSELTSPSREPSPATTLMLSVARSIQNRFSDMDEILDKVYKSGKAGVKVSKYKWFKEQNSVEQILHRVEKEMHQLGSMASVLTVIPVVQAQVKIEPAPDHDNNAVISQTTNNTLIKQHAYRTLYRHQDPGRPKITRSLFYFISVLIASFSGEPTHCNNRSCSLCQQRAVIFYFQILLPTWFLARSIMGSISYDRRRGLYFRHLRFPRVRPISDDIFYFAFLNNHDAILEKLSTGNATPWDVDPFGNNLLAYALLRTRPEKGLLQLLVNQGVRRTAGFTKIYQVVQDLALIGQGGNDLGYLLSDYISLEVHHYENLQYSHHIMNATHANAAAVLEMLLSGRLLEDPDAMLNTQNEWGETAVCLSMRRLSFGITKLLIEYGADVSICDWSGLNVLHYAALFAPRAIIHALANSPPSCNMTILPRPRITFRQIQSLRSGFKTCQKAEGEEKLVDPIDDEWWFEWENLVAITAQDEDVDFVRILEGVVQF